MNIVANGVHVPTGAFTHTIAIQVAKNERERESNLERERERERLVNGNQ